MIALAHGHHAVAVAAHQRPHRIDDERLGCRGSSRLDCIERVLAKRREGPMHLTYTPEQEQLRQQLQANVTIIERLA